MGMGPMNRKNVLVGSAGVESGIQSTEGQEGCHELSGRASLVKKRKGSGNPFPDYLTSSVEFWYPSAIHV